MQPKNGWIVLSAWGFAAGLSQLLGMSFAPILTLVEVKYHVTEFQAGLLILVFPLTYALLSIPAGTYIDTHGYRKGAGLGIIVATFFCWLRVFDSNFWILLLAQTGIALAQPFIVNAISKLVLDWFPKEHEALATGIGTMAMFIGMAVGMAASPFLVKLYDLRGSSIVFSLLATFSVVLFFAFVKKNPTPFHQEDEKSGVRIKDLFKNLNLIKIFVLALLGIGFFNGLTTWFELILAPRGISSEQAGIAGGVLILGGIVGAGVVPALSDYFQKRKPFLILCTFVAGVTIYPLCEGSSYYHVILFSALQGFFFLPAFSLLLEMCAETVGKAHAAAATGILMLLGNVGGVFVVIAMQVIKGKSPNFDSGVHFLFALIVIAFLLALTVPETRKA